MELGLFLRKEGGISTRGCGLRDARLRGVYARQSDRRGAPRGGGRLQAQAGVRGNAGIGGR